MKKMTEMNPQTTRIKATVPVIVIQTGGFGLYSNRSQPTNPFSEGKRILKDMAKKRTAKAPYP